MDDATLRMSLQHLLDIAGRVQFRRIVQEMLAEKVNPRREVKKTFTWAQIKTAYKRQRGICPACRREMALDRKTIHGDHIDPNLEVGLNDVLNCAALHARCNLHKGPKTLIELYKDDGSADTVKDYLERTHGITEDQQE